MVLGSVPRGVRATKGVSMTGFIQIMEFQTDDIDAVERFATDMVEQRGDRLLATRSTVCSDRDRPGTFLVIVEFESYGEAMRNSEDPETSRYATQLVSLLDGEPSFRNLDVRTVLG
jgi:hypothetical protein